MDPIYSRKGQRPERKKNVKKKKTPQNKSAKERVLAFLPSTLNIILLQRSGEPNPPTLFFLPCAQYSGEAAPPKNMPKVLFI